MKNFLKLFALFACFATLFAACNSDETVDDYTPKVKSFETYDMVAGSEKIHVTWTVPNDESITGTKISWSGATKGSHSISDLTANDQMDYTITGLKDGGSYTVTIENLVGGYVGTGSVFVSGLKVYGPQTYAEATLPTLGAIAHDGTKATVEWTAGGGENVGVDITYTDVNGLSASAEAIFASSTTAELLKAQEGTTFTCKALFQPVGGYDYAEVTMESDDFFIASSELTAATPEILSTLGGKKQIQFSWSVTEDVIQSSMQIYEVAADGDKEVSLITIGGDALEEIIADGVATYTTGVAVTAGKSYKVEITNYIDINSTSTATKAVMSEQAMFVYDDDTYNEPTIASVINDRGVVSISWDMSGDKVIASDMVRVEVSYTDENDESQVAVYDTYDTPLILAAKSNSNFTAKAFYMPENSIEGAEHEVVKDVDVTTVESNEGEIPAPILYAPQNMVLSPGCKEGESYLKVSWDALTEFDLEEAKSVSIYYKKDDKNDLTTTGTKVVVDKSLGEQVLEDLEPGSIYFVVLSTVNGDDYETVGSFFYAQTYNQDTYSAKVLEVKSIARSGENNTDATITWNWATAGNIAVGVEVIEYTDKDGQLQQVAKAKREDAETTVLANVKGGTDVKYSAYYCPEGGLDSLSVAQATITAPYLTVADAPALTALAGVGESAPFVQVTWDSFDTANVASATLYYQVKPDADVTAPYQSIVVEDVTAGVAVIENLETAKEYDVYMLLTDNDGVEHTPEELAIVSSPALYDADTYKDAAAVTILSENGATFDGTDLTITLDLSGAAEELVGVLASYTLADDTAATAGNKDFVITGESIPETLVLSGIKAGTEYTLTPYYRPSNGVTAVAGGNTATLQVPAVAPTVAVVTGIVSSYNKSGDGSEPEITVNWTLENNAARPAIQNSKMYVMVAVAGDEAASAAAEVSVEDGVETYSATINATTNDVQVDKVYTIYVETRDADGVPYVSNSVADVKSYNASTYSVANIPAILVEYDKYTETTVAEWDAEALDADLTSMSFVYNGQTTPVDMAAGTQSVAYSSAATSAVMAATFLPTAVEAADGAIAATYGETVDVSSDEVGVEDMLYDILNTGTAYQIFTAKGLVAFAGIVNGSYTEAAPNDVKSNILDWAQNTAASATVEDNLDFIDVAWTPIAGYVGVFDGGSANGFTISNLTIDSTATNQGLFASLATGATVQNVTLSNVSIKTTSNTVGAIVGTTTGATINNCTVDSGTITGGTNVGGIAGTNYRTSIVDCTNSAVIVSTATGNSATSGAGGIVGTMGVKSATDADATQRTMIQNCTNNGSISAVAAYVGGMVGSVYCNDAAAFGYTVTGCTNNGAIETTTGPAGGIAGYSRAGVAGNVLLTESVNNGTITTAAVNTAGIAGYTTGAGVTISNCTNNKSATVKSTNSGDGYTGGIAGQVAGLSTLESCNNYADVYGVTAVGGVVGNKNGETTIVSYCNNEGNVTGTTNVGGIAGVGKAPLTGTESDYNYNSGVVSGVTNVGGLVGNNTGKLSYYINKGEVFVDGVSSSISNGLIGIGEGVVSNCENYFETSAAEAVTSVAAYPTYFANPDGDASIIVVSWSYGDVSEIKNATGVNVYYKTTDEDSYEVVAFDAALSMTEASIPVTADKTYDIYVSTVTADGIETSSDVTETLPLIVSAYNSNSYDEKIPAVASVKFDSGNVVITWTAESFDADLESVAIKYGDAESVSYNKAALAEPISLSYLSDVEAFTYTSTFKPAAYAENDAVPSVTTGETSVELPAQPAQAVSNVVAYPTYTAGDESDTSTINVSWEYGESTSRISSVVVYYKKSTDEEYSSAILTGATAEEYALGAENETIDANETYSVYVATRNAENNDTAMSGDAFEIETYDSSSYGVDNLPKITSVDNNGNLFNINIDAESIDADLSEVVVAYGDEKYGFDREELMSMTVSPYDAEVSTFTYTATFVPAAYKDYNPASVEVVVTEPVAVPAPAAEAAMVEVYPSYTTEADVDNSNITVEWAYEDGSSLISAVKIYYRAVGAANFEAVSITENVATTTTASIPSLTAGEAYEVYVSTLNADGGETESNYTAAAPATVEAYNSGSYDATLVPSVGATQDGTDVTLVWANTEAEDLVSVDVLYNEATTTILKSELETKTIAYVAGKTTFTYTANFAPTAKSAVVVVAAEAEVTIVAEGTDISLNGEVYEIYTAKGLAAFAGLVNGTAATTAPTVESNITDWTQNKVANAKLMDSFSLSTVCGAEVGEGTSWNPIGNADAIYAGEFDGNGMTISDLYINATTQLQGLFGWVAAATIKDITLTNIDVTYGGEVSHYAGPMVARMNGAGLISGCEVASGTINITTTKAAYVGGVVGNLLGRGVVDNCINRANITSSIQQVGGIVGGVVNTINATLGTIKNCKNYGDLNVTNYAGGIVGYIQNGSATEECTVEYCENYGDITGTEQLSGIAGSVRSRTAAGTARVIGCVNNGKITSTSTKAAYVGSMVGLALNSADAYVRVENCTNNGDIDASKASFVGGLVGGDTAAGGFVVVTNSTNNGDVTAVSNVGGIISITKTAGSALTGDETNFSYNNGNITGTGSNIGAFVGSNLGTITNYKNTGKVSPEQLLVGYGTAADSETCVDEYVSEDVTPAAEAVTAAAALNSTEDGIDVSWSYGEAKENISKVVVYYKAADGATYTSKEVYGNTAESVSLTSRRVSS